MTTTRSETLSKDREPYAIVKGCDGRGGFALIGVYPNKRGDCTIYYIVARVVDGVRNGFINPRYDADCMEDATEDGTYAIRITLAEALVLFLDPLVVRTKKMPPEAIPVIRWWQKHRQPGPQRFEDLVMPLLGKRELARMAEYTPTKAIEFFRESTEAESKALEEHVQKFTDHFFATIWTFKTWFLNEAELEELGVTARTPAPEIMQRWVKSENLLQRHIQMAAHMQLLYNVGGEHPDLADLWSTEVKIQTDRGRFLDSGLPQCVHNLTSQIHEYHACHVEPSCRIFQTLEIEKKGLTVLQGMGAWTCFVNQRSSVAEDPIWKDLHYETFRLLKAGVSNIFRQLQDRLPKLDTEHNKTIKEALAELLLFGFIEWNIMYFYRHEGPLASADKDPPSDFVTGIFNLIVTEEKSMMNHAQEVSQATALAFWDVACMAIHPELFDYPTGSGRGVRKTTPPAIARTRPPSFEKALPPLMAAFCSLDDWLGRFSKVKRPTLKKLLTVTVHPPETASVQRILSPRHFSLEEDIMVPSDELLQRATDRDDQTLTSLLKLMAVQLPHTTLKVLEGVKQLCDKIVKLNERARAKLEDNRSTSTTKMQKEQCAGCGSKEETEKRPMKCSRCLIVGYCSVACQKKHWLVHKKVCAPVNK
jgi:hypothetical protein